MMDMKLCKRKRSWPNINYYNGTCVNGLRITTKPLRIACLRVEICTQDLQYTNQVRLYHDVNRILKLYSTINQVITKAYKLTFLFKQVHENGATLSTNMTSYSVLHNVSYRMFDADSIRDGSLLQHKYFTARAEFHYRLSKHTKPQR